MCSNRARPVWFETASLLAVSSSRKSTIFGDNELPSVNEAVSEPEGEI